MAQATTGQGDLQPISNCFMQIEGVKVYPRIMPDISSQKSASYNDEAIVGRSFPVKTFSHSENRSISIEWHFIALKESDVQKNLNELRLIESATYPRDGQNGAPYRPPPVCRLQCGKLLGDDGVCAILRSYSVKFPTDQVLDEQTLLPYTFDVSMSWEVVYASSDLPGQDRIRRRGS